MGELLPDSVEKLVVVPFPAGKLSLRPSEGREKSSSHPLQSGLECRAAAVICRERDSRK